MDLNARHSETDREYISKVFSEGKISKGGERGKGLNGRRVVAQARVRQQEGSRTGEGLVTLCKNGGVQSRSGSVLSQWAYVCCLGSTLYYYTQLSTPPEIARAAPGTPEAARRRRRHCECRQKGGKRRRVRSRLKAKPFKTQLSTIFLSNARPIWNKMDEIRLQLLIQIHMDNCKSLIFTETWLDSTTLAVAIELAGCTNYRVDRTAD